MPTLAELLEGCRFELVHGDPGIDITALRVDSREVRPGDVFVCLPGYRSEGGEVRADRHDFIPAALERGARALVVDRPVEPPAGVTVVRTTDAWATVARMACNFYGQPSLSMRMVGITGTSGKTSTAYFIESLLTTAGLAPACLGTIEYRLAGQTIPARQTTPEAPELQRLLRQALDAGCRSVVMEVSSHALELRRVGGIAFDVGIFTNLSQDHLNFHPDMEHYRRAKERLFESLGGGGKRATAVINRDDPASGHMIASNRGALLTFGLQPGADVVAADVRAGLSGTSFRAVTPKGDVAVRLPHLGDYQVYNALAALTTGLALGLDLETIGRGLETAPAIPGRFELVDCGQSFRVAVDYAHKPDALARLLQSARALHPHRIITVFGCGGDRDRGKRPIMGRIAAELSDLVIITSDNPRSEDPQAIVHEVAAGTRGIGTAEVRLEADRGKAIELAIAAAEPDDIVLIAGKGHETYQLFAERRIHFDDREQARQALLHRA